MKIFSHEVILWAWFVICQFDNGINICNTLLMKVLDNRKCSIDACCQVLTDRNDFVLIQRLFEKKQLRFVDLHRLIGHLSTRTLTKRLKHLEKNKIIKRQAFRESPPRVEYSLSPKGFALRKVLLAMTDWSKRYS